MSEFKEELLDDIKDDDGLTLKDRAFLAFLVNDARGDVRKAMDLAGFPKDLPMFIITKRLKKQIQEISKDFLAAQTLRASIELVNVFNDPTALGAKNVIAASKEVLDRGGVNKEETLNVTAERSMFVLPAKVVEEVDEE